MSGIIRNSFLASVLATPRAGTIDADNLYRRYKSTIRTSTTLGGNEDSRLQQITYEVGRATDTKGRALRRPAEGTTVVEAAYPTPPALQEDFVGLAKKFSNFSADFGWSSLASVVERLARGLAATSVWDNVTSTDLRAGRALTIDALGTFDGPVSPLTTTVFIPRLVNTILTGDVFAVLANAVAGAGAGVATDVVELDAITRQPIVALVDGPGLPRAIVAALRILGANMIAADQGPLFAFALTRGIHRVVSVVGHTDEGGLIRDTLRLGDFGTPFGGIHYGLEPYAGIPALATNSSIEVSAYVDALALTSAALVAHCDPGMEYDGRWFPTFYLGTSSDDPTLRPGSQTEYTPAMGLRNRAQFVANVASFWDIYIPNLSTLFAANGDAAVATTVACTFTQLLNGNSRHLAFPSIAPYFWIEPTSLLPHDFAGTRAEAEGCGSFGGRDATRTHAAWEDIVSASPRDTAFSGYHAVVRNPRSAWFFAHWLNHPLNGLGAISVRQLDANAIIHPGGDAEYPDVRDRIENGVDWTRLLWVRGQSPFCAPGELLNLAGTVGMYVKHVTFDDDGFPNVEHVPTALEFLHCDITMHVGRPMGLQVGQSNAPDLTVRRAKTRAARELAAASARARLFGRPDVGEMPTLASAPILRSRAPHDRDEGRNENTGGGSAGWVRGAMGGADVEGPPPREPTGAPRPPVPHYEPVRFPAIQRAGLNVPGGGGVAIPPNPPHLNIVHDGPDDDTPAPPVAIPGVAPPERAERQ